MRRVIPRWVAAAAALVAVATTTVPLPGAVLIGAAETHDPGLSVVEVRIEDARLVAHLTYARLDIERLVPLDADGDGRVTPVELAAARPRLESLAREALEVRQGARLVPARVQAIRLDASDALHLHLTFAPPGSAPLRLRSSLLARLPRGHRQYLAVRAATPGVIADRVLEAGADAFELPSARVSTRASGAGSFREFGALGVEHIWTGYDHLVFLLGLLLAGGSFRGAIKIVTSFTVAHSITLALATFELVRVPPRVVEPLIASSIVYVGLENVLRRDLEGRWRLTFAFGLVHGLGFASVLRDLGVGRAGGGVLVPLLSFNLGVEVGQVALAGLALPLIWRLRREPWVVRRWIPAGSVVIALAGGYWLLARTLLA